MSHRFDSTHKLASNQGAAIAAMAGVRDEVTGGGDRRRRWSKADEARIVQESLEPGAVVSEVAQRHGLTRWQLYDWRRKARAARRPVFAGLPAFSASSCALSASACDLARLVSSSSSASAS